MLRLLTLAAAATTSAALLVATAGPALAQAPGAHYVAVPAEPGSKTEFVTRTTVWRLRDGAWVARKSADRDTILCGLVAAQAGRLVSFTAGSVPLASDALERCNARAR